jgi:tetratricopeptide (TPR) repeat protein
MDEAIATYERCLTINPKNAQTFLSLGYTYHLKFDLQQALHYYHKAHFLKNDDNLIEELVNAAMDDINNTQIFPLETTYLNPSSNAHNVESSSQSSVVGTDALPQQVALGMHH